MVTIAALHRDVSCALDRALGMMREGDLAGAELELRRALQLRRALLAQEGAVLVSMEATLPSEVGEFASFAAAALSTAADTRRRNGRHVPAVTADVVAVLVQVAASDGVGRQTRDRAAPARQPDVVPAAPSLLLTPTEAAALLRISPRSLRALRAAGQIETVAIGGLTRYRRQDIEAVAAAGPRSFRADITAKGTPGTRAGVCSRGAGPINDTQGAA